MVGGCLRDPELRVLGPTFPHKPNDWCGMIGITRVIGSAVRIRTSGALSKTELEGPGACFSEDLVPTLVFGPDDLG